MHFEESKRLVNSSVLFPLTPALSLGGEGESHAVSLEHQGAGFAHMVPVPELRPLNSLGPSED